MKQNWQVGIDIGGTFTDVVAVLPTLGEVRSAKVATRIDDRVAGLLSALAAVSLDWSEVDDLILGTTMVTNAIVEDDLADIALIATEGFSDTLAIGRQNRLHLYRLDLPSKIKPQVQPEHRFEVSERLDQNGQVLNPLDEASLEVVLDQIAATGVKAVAVSLLHSYANPNHEEQLGRRLRERFPFVALSNQVNPEAREFERTATTALSASVMPLAAGQLDRLEAIKPRNSRLHLFHSAGGMASPAALRDLPLGLAMSGPAAGVAAAGHIAGQLGIKQALSFDMGGTTTDVCLISDGQAVVTSDRALGGRPMRLPMVAVESIGAGGGSIARLDHGALVVGPESAGAFPGPACYGKGGTKPTVSDANIILGYLDADRVLGSDLRLDVSAARKAIKPLADEMGMSIAQTALGIVRVANSAMVRALRRITVEQGIDGRQCTLLAFGGAGPMHAVDVARDFGIGRVVVPAFSSMFSALGCVSADMSYTRQQTLRMSSLDWDAIRLGSVRDALRTHLKTQLADPLKSAGLTEHAIAIVEVAQVRYRGQSYAIEITDPTFGDPAALGEAFQGLHGKLYGFATDEPWELVSIRMTASVPQGENRARTPLSTGTQAEPVKSTPCVFEQSGEVQTPRYERSSLPINHPICGPLVVEDAFSTVIVPPGATLTADDAGNLLIDIGERQ
ncbi:MAG: hydantoinase/oxoprolinase family protein [Rhodobacteraceae bacterium]|nr:hydantoinase/oxoprolinase family protein [Paracoccaceae bacterium]